MAIPNECLICCTPTDAENNWTELLINNEITAYFVISKLLEISQSNFIDWLGDGKNPSDWILFCKKCFSAVSEAQKIFSQLLQLEAKWKQAKRNVEKKICGNYKWSENSEQNYSISNIIREETVKRLECLATVKVESNSQFCGNFKCDNEDNDCEYNSDSELWFPHMEGGDPTTIPEEYKPTSPQIKMKTKVKYKNSKRKTKSSERKKIRLKPGKVDKKKTVRLAMKKETDVIETHSSSRSRRGRAIKRIKYNHDLQNESEEDCEIGPYQDTEFSDTGGESDYNPAVDIDCEDTNSGVNGNDHEKKSPSEKLVETDEFSCQFCTKTFKTLKYAQIHEFRAHSKKHKCEDCGKEYRNFYNMRAHIDLHHNTSENKTVQMPYECNKCEFFFKTERLLEFHTKQAHEGVEKAYLCHHCGKAFSLQRQLRRHELTVHTEDKPFHCKQCRFATDTENKMKRHLFTVHESKDPVYCPECNKDMKCQYRLKQHIEMVHKKQKNFVCEHCCASFTQMASLKYHQMGQHNVVFEDLCVSVKCEICGKVVSNPQQLQKHILSVHEKKYRFHCPICNAGRQTKDLIDKHIILAHTDKRPFACSLCDKSYISKGKLEDHFRTHTGERPFVCSICQKAFSCKKYLEAHEKIHTTEKNFPCDLCPKRFPNAQYLGHHKWYVHQRQKSKMPPKQLVDKSLLEAVATSGGYKKTKTLLSSISDSTDLPI